MTAGLSSPLRDMTRTAWEARLYRRRKDKDKNRNKKRCRGVNQQSVASESAGVRKERGGGDECNEGTTEDCKTQEEESVLARR